MKEELSESVEISKIDLATTLLTRALNPDGLDSRSRKSLIQEAIDILNVQEVKDVVEETVEETVPSKE